MVNFTVTVMPFPLMHQVPKQLAGDNATDVANITNATEVNMTEGALSRPGAKQIISTIYT